MPLPPPEEVLRRDASPNEPTVEGHSANEADLITSRSVLKRDRILVKVGWTPSEDVPKDYTERLSGRYDVKYDPFREYMVVFSHGQMELWDDPSCDRGSIGRTSTLKLRYVAPLRRAMPCFALLTDRFDLLPQLYPRATS